MVATRHVSLPQNISEMLLRLELRLRPTREAHGAPRTLLDFKATSQWRDEGKDKKREVREGERRRGEGDLLPHLGSIRPP